MVDRPPQFREPIFDLAWNLRDRVADPAQQVTGFTGLTADALETVLHERNLFAGTIEILSLGVILTDGSGRIAQANRTARALLHAGTALRHADDRLLVCAPDCAVAFSHAVEQAERGMARDMSERSFVVPIVGADHELVAWVFPAAVRPYRSAANPTRGGAIIFVKDLGDVSPFPIEFLMRRFGMTSAECRLLDMLTRGRTIREAAAALGTSTTTAKTHLAHLFKKTGTRRQADLVRLTIRAFAPASV